MMVCLDTNCLIYLIENHPYWGPKVVSRLSFARSSNDTIAVSDLARAECLVGPLKSGDTAAVADYQRFFASTSVQMLPLTPAVCERAASIRATSAIKIGLPDALHLASAVEHHCGLFLTNDARLANFAQINVELLA